MYRMKVCFGLAIALLVAPTAQATFLEDFESGYTDNTSINGINGWVNVAAGGVIAQDDLGKGGGWGGETTLGWQGSRVLHGETWSSGDTVVMEADLKPSTDGNPQILLFADTSGAGGAAYLYVELDPQEPKTTNLIYHGYYESAPVFLNYVDVGVTTDWYHAKLTWNVGTDATMEVWDAADAVVFTKTETYTQLPDLHTIRLSSNGAAGGVFDNVSLAINPISTPSTTHDWNATGSGDWNTASNWAPASVPNSNLSVAGFGSVITGAATVTTSAPVTVAGIVFDNLNSVEIAASTGANIVTLDGNGSTVPSISVLQGSHEFTAPVTLADSASVNVESGATLNLNNTINLNSNTLTAAGGGTVNLNGTVNTGGGAVVVAGGVVNGTGTVTGDLTNSGGTVAPGLSSGTLNVVTGDYSQTDGSLLIEIEGLTPDTEHDVLDVTGNLTLSGGTLDVEVDFPGAAPGDSFSIFSVTGTIDTSGATINVTDLGAGLIWVTSALDTTGAISLAVLGDFDGNGTVGLEDYTIMKANWLSTGFALNTFGEVTGPGGVPDGVVDAYDFLEFRTNLFPGGASAFASALASAVPEPSTAILLLAAAPACLLLRPAQRKGRSVRLYE